MKYKIDVVRIRENSIELNGWVIGKTPQSRAEFQVQDGNRQLRRIYSADFNLISCHVLTSAYEFSVAHDT